MVVDYFIYKSLIFQHEVSRMENLFDKECTQYNEEIGYFKIIPLRQVCGGSNGNWIEFVYIITHLSWGDTQY